jgi:hypothetical protein
MLCSGIDRGLDYTNRKIECPLQAESVQVVRQRFSNSESIAARILAIPDVFIWQSLDI